MTCFNDFLTVKKTCSMCMKEKCTGKCGKCKGVYYCSTDCQKTDWESHKIDCMNNHKKSVSVLCGFLVSFDKDTKTREDLLKRLGEYPPDSVLLINVMTHKKLMYKTETTIMSREQARLLLRYLGMFNDERKKQFETTKNVTLMVNNYFETDGNPHTFTMMLSLK